MIARCGKVVLALPLCGVLVCAQAVPQKQVWKCYLLVDVKEQEVYEIDPQTVKPAGDNVEWSLADKPSEPIETVEWKTRDIGPMQRVAFRLGKAGHVLDLQIPLKPNGQPAY